MSDDAPRLQQPPTTPSLWKELVPASFLISLRSAVSEHVEPVAEQTDREDVYPVRAIKELARLGYTSLTLDPAVGGAGANSRRALALFEEVSYASAAVGISLITIFQAQTLIKTFGSTELRDAVLPRFREGLLTSYALTEAKHGSDIRHLDTTATRFDGGWELNGRKSFITSGSAAEAFVILAESPAGISTFYVQADCPGVSTEKTTNAATFGLRNGPHVDLKLDRVRVPSQYLIGEDGRGIRQALTTLDHSRTMAAGISLGIARAAFEGALRFARTRIAFDQSVVAFQGIEWYFAQMVTAIDSARLLAYSSADCLDDHIDIDRHSSEAKLFGSEVATDVAARCVQICGAYGVMESAPFGRYLRDAKAYEIAGGSSEILKNTIAKSLHRQRLTGETE
jgi:alkylation response protein AidB-like acyl-CoA dehydrogenase